MSWGEEFETTVFIKSQTVRDVAHAKEMVEDEQSFINDWIAKLKMYAISNPKDIVSSDWEDEKVNYVAHEIDSIMEVIRDSYNLISKLYLYIDKHEIYDKDTEN